MQMKTARKQKAKARGHRKADAAGAKSAPARTVRPDRKCCAVLDRALDPQLFKALSDPTRLQVLLCVARGCDPVTVSRVADCCAVDFSVVSRHLAILRDAGVVTVQKKGREVYYAVCYGQVAGVLRQIANALEACCPEGK